MQRGEVRNPVTVLLLSLFTCGIYAIYWQFFLIPDELNEGLGRREFSGMKDLVLTLWTCGLYGLYHMWHVAEATEELQRSWGVEPEMEKAVLFAMAFVYVYPFFVQKSLNNAWERGAPGGTDESSTEYDAFGPPPSTADDVSQTRMSTSEDAPGANDIPVRTQSLPLEETPYLERFNRMVEELRQNSKVDVLEYEVNPPATEAEFAAAEAYLGHPLPEAMRRFYTQANGLKLTWALKSADESRSAHGNISLLPIERVFSDWKDVVYFDVDFDDGRYKPVHPVDYFVAEACAALHLDGSANPTVHYHYFGEELQSMEVDFAGYLELLLKSRGYWYWQTAVSGDVTGSIFTLEPREFRLGMPKVFQDYDAHFFFRNDYSTEDAEFLQRLQSQGGGVRQALENAGVQFTVQDEDGRKMDVPDDPANIEKFIEAMGEISPGTDFEREWSVLQLTIEVESPGDDWPQLQTVLISRSTGVWSVEIMG